MFFVEKGGQIRTDSDVNLEAKSPVVVEFLQNCLQRKFEVVEFVRGRGRERKYHV